MDDYLALRQQLKQSIRAQLQRDSGSATNSIGGGHAHNNYGCFFGRSETVFAGKAVKQISNLWSKLKVDIDSKKDSAAAMRKKKVQRFKETREYSFLSSSFEGEICSTAPPIKRDAKRGSITKEEPTKLTVKGGFKRGEMTKNPRKLMEKGGKRDSADQKSNSSRAKKESRSVSKQEAKRSASKQSEQKKKEAEGQKKRWVEKREREEAYFAINIIRELFGYDPTRFCDDDEEYLNMEASFAEIQKEERRSAKIASKEDRRELRKLETECGNKRKLMN